MNPHTPVLYYNPKWNRPLEPRAALVTSATDKPGHVHLAVFSHPEHDVSRMPVERAAFVRCFETMPDPAPQDGAYCVVVMDDRLEEKLWNRGLHPQQKREVPASQFKSGPGIESPYVPAVPPAARDIVRSPMVFGGMAKSQLDGLGVISKENAEDIERCSGVTPTMKGAKRRAADDSFLCPDCGRVWIKPNDNGCPECSKDPTRTPEQPETPAAPAPPPPLAKTPRKR